MRLSRLATQNIPTHCAGVLTRAQQGRLSELPHVLAKARGSCKHLLNADSLQSLGLSVETAASGWKRRWEEGKQPSPVRSLCWNQASWEEKTGCLQTVGHSNTGLGQRKSKTGIMGLLKLASRAKGGLSPLSKI